jgi:hypothetical protein
VCDTDRETVELIIKEIVAQIKDHVMRGCNIRLFFKVGTMVIRNGEIQWKHCQEKNSSKSPDITSRDKSLMPSNASTTMKHMRDLSVVTPSIFSKKSKSK